MNIPSLEFYVESIRHLTSSVAIRRLHINWLEQYLKNVKVCGCADWVEEIKDTQNRLGIIRAKQKHEKRMIAYFVAQQRDILDYYKATDELYEETL